MMMERDQSMNKRKKREYETNNSLNGWDATSSVQVLEDWFSEEANLSSDSAAPITSDQEQDRIEETLIENKKRSFAEIDHINNISKDPTKVRLPRVLKNDIRKKYPIMYINMLNMCDLDLIDQFFKKYTNRSSSFSEFIHFGGKTIERITEKENEQSVISKDISLNALNDVINFIILLTILSPDRYVRMKRFEVITRSDTFKTVVHVYYELVGTRISYWTPIDAGNYLLSMRDRHQISRQELMERFQASLPRMESFVPLQVEGKLTMNIDNSRNDLRISNIISDSVPIAY